MAVERPRHRRGGRGARTAQLGDVADAAPIGATRAAGLRVGSLEHANTLGGRRVVVKPAVADPARGSHRARPARRASSRRPLACASTIGITT